MQRAIVSTEEKVLLSALYDNSTKAHNAIRRSLQARLRNKTLTMDTVVWVRVIDASGYFTSCLEIFPGHYDKVTTVSEYLR